jgi:hypothetical protein
MLHGNSSSSDSDDNNSSGNDSINQSADSIDQDEESDDVMVVEEPSKKSTPASKKATKNTPSKKTPARSAAATKTPASKGKAATKSAKKAPPKATPKGKAVSKVKSEAKSAANHSPSDELASDGPSRGDASAKPKLKRVKSVSSDCLKGRVPLVANITKTTTTMLMAVETTEKALDVEADTGSIGRFTHDPSTQGKTRAKIDIKGKQFMAGLVPSATYMVVGFGQTRVDDTMVAHAKVESIMNDVCVLTHYGDELLKIGGVVTGKQLDASFKHVEEDVNYKPRGGQGAQGSDSEEGGKSQKGKAKRKKSKSGDAAASKPAPKKARAKPAKK